MNARDATRCLCPFGADNVPNTATCHQDCEARLPELCWAIGGRRVVRFLYDGYLRSVEPHVYGVTARGNQALRGYQRNYGGLTPEPGWHIFRLDRMTGFASTTNTFEHARPGYEAADEVMGGFFARLSEGRGAA